MVLALLLLVLGPYHSFHIFSLAAPIWVLYCSTKALSICSTSMDLLSPSCCAMESSSVTISLDSRNE